MSEDPEMVKLRHEVESLAYELKQMKEREGHHKQKLERLYKWARDMDKGSF